MPTSQVYLFIFHSLYMGNKRPLHLFFFHFIDYLGVLAISKTSSQSTLIQRLHPVHIQTRDVHSERNEKKNTSSTTAKTNEKQEAEPRTHIQHE